MAANTGPKTSDGDDGWLSRERALAIALVVFTAVVLYLCYRLVLPFLPALAWALALAVMAHPMNHRLNTWIHNRTLSSAISVFVVVVLIVIPVIFVTQNIVREASNYSQLVQKEFSSGKWRQAFARNPRLKPVLHWIDVRVSEQFGTTPPAENDDESSRDDPSRPSTSPDQATSEQATTEQATTEQATTEQAGAASQDEATFDQPSDVADETQSSPADDPHHEFDSESSGGDRSARPENTREQTSRKQNKQEATNGLTKPKSALPSGVAQVERAASIITQGVSSVLTGSIWLVMQLFITVLTLFFFFRDRSQALGVLRSLMPLSHSEINEMFSRVDDTIHATIYGSLVVAIVQGALGGLMFWFLGLPSPLMWGAVMALLAVVPILGTFVIWAPTAGYLALTGEWGKALVLVIWGSCAIGLIDNFLYPFLVGKRLRFHTLIVFFAIVGGLALFGASGIILGPLIMAIADALLDIWRKRTAFGGTIEAGVQPTT